MEALIRRTIEAEAKKRIARYSQNAYYTKKYRKAFKKRTGVDPKISPHGIPQQWDFHKHYDPRYCLNHSKFLAKGVWNSLQSGHYKPTTAIRTKIAKASGGFRCIDSFSIPDAAIAKIFLSRLRVRNAKIFSDSSYAYQEGKVPLDAVLRLRTLINDGKIFISQYDFKKYFDSIQHDYIFNLLQKDGPFLTTNMERAVLQAVMTHEYVEKGAKPTFRTRGIPQGNSLSLFLANLAAHPLDVELSKLSGAFARFADDSVVINYSYEDALKCTNAFVKFSSESGVDINNDKSSGIRIFSARPAEMASISEFVFLSYRFTPKGLFVSKRAVDAIKRRCARIIYNHLLLYPRRVDKVSKARVGFGFRDWDLVTCLNELRNYVYGGRSQQQIEGFLEGRISLKNLSGAVSYFCLVEDSAIFRELDGWLVDALYRAYCARVRFINGLKSGRKIGEIAKKSILQGDWYRFPHLAQETRPPSFFIAWRAAKLSWNRHGLGGVDRFGLGYAYP